MDNFGQMQLAQAVQDALAAISFTTPTPIQAQAIPLVLEGHDILGSAQTGTGKTAAFSVPLLSMLVNGSQKPVLILAPTRELAEQIAATLALLTSKLRQFRLALVIGGVPMYHQIRNLRNNPAFVIATPGRLIDHVERGNINLSDFGYLVLDEADRMLDMGFGPQLDAIVKELPADRQTLLFSATMPANIQKIAARYLRNPKRISIGESHKPVEKIKQTLVETTAHSKPDTLIREIDKHAGSMLVFTRTKVRTEAVTKLLRDAGHKVTRIHGDRSQRQRSDAIAGFRSGDFRILVATDIAARGIDIADIQHVINYDLPICPEDYVHRIGRTARAGAEGHALCLITPEDRHTWSRIHKLMYGQFPDGDRGGRSGVDSRPQSRRPSFARTERGEGGRRPSSRDGGGRGGPRASFGSSSSGTERSFRPRPQQDGERSFRPRPQEGGRSFARNAAPADSEPSFRTRAKEGGERSFGRGTTKPEGKAFRPMGTRPTGRPVLSKKADGGSFEDSGSKTRRFATAKAFARPSAKSENF
jgi:ATP-dependent RNA helicase DeaD